MENEKQQQPIENDEIQLEMKSTPPESQENQEPPVVHGSQESHELQESQRVEAAFAAQEPQADQQLNDLESVENRTFVADHQEPMEKVYRPAGFFIRLVAYLVDLAVINAVLGIISGIVAVDVKALPLLAVSFVTIGLAGALYFTLMTCFFGQTLGKMIAGIRVIQSNGTPPGLLTAFFRETVGRTLSQLLGVHMGYWWCAFHPKKQGWHDLISDTYVVHDRSAERAREIRIPVAVASGESF
ncbi:RDD family protein [Anoxynatronum sibiricum]|uniref:RDD family protein n=1 Tax=Anoxynatronum sibiricum TaxID=210623 RepID=A0ABU9VW28_9CLOT